MTLVWLAAAFILGVFLGFQAHIPYLALLAPATAACLLAVLLWRRYRYRLALLILALLLVGVARGESARLHIGPGDVAYYNGQTATVVGFVNAEPDIRDKGNNYVIAVQKMQRGGVMVPMQGQIELHTASGQVLEAGDQVQITGILQTPINSPQIPYRSILANRGIYTEIAFPRMFVTGHVSLGLVGIALQIRQWIESSISVALPDPEGTLLIAIIVGARSAQLGNLAPVLVQTGLIHLVAVSGIKIAIVAGTVNAFVRRLLSRTLTLLVSTSVLGAYWLVSGATVAGLRASIMWLLVFIAAYLGRPTYALVSLGVAASVMLAITPTLLWDTGFQLTTLATASIIAFSPLMERLTRRVPSALAASISTTTAAQVGVLPVQIFSFHVVSPVSLLSNAVVLPFIPVTMVVGFATAVFPHGPVAAVAFSLVHVLILIARIAARIPLTNRARQLPTDLSLLYYGVLAGLAVVVWRLGATQRRPVRGEWAFGLSIAAIGLGIALQAPAPGSRISFITNGDALLTSHGQTVLIDGGSSPSKLLSGLGTALPYPNNRLDVIIDTTPSAKNVASLEAVVQRIAVGKVIDPGIEYPTQTYARWRGALRTKGVPTLALRPGLVVRGRGFSIRALAPDGVYSTVKDGAGALLISAGQQRILYLGDASPREQQDLPFLTRVSAQTVIASVPIDPTLRAAVGYRRLIRPIHGHSLALGP